MVGLYNRMSDYAGIYLSDPNAAKRQFADHLSVGAWDMVMGCIIAGVLPFLQRADLLYNAVRDSPQLCSTKQQSPDFHDFNLIEACGLRRCSANWGFYMLLQMDTYRGMQGFHSYFLLRAEIHFIFSLFSELNPHECINNCAFPLASWTQKRTRV